MRFLFDTDQANNVKKYKNWAIPGLFFLYFLLFNTQLTVNNSSIYK